MIAVEQSLSVMCQEFIGTKELNTELNTAGDLGCSNVGGIQRRANTPIMDLV